MNHDPLDEWASLWQSQRHDIEHLREDFMRRQRKESLSFWGGIMAISLMVAFLLKTMPDPEKMFHFLFHCGATVLAIAAGVQVIWFHWHKQTTLPLSPKGYIEKCRHNLALDQRNVLWGQRIWPISLLFLVAALVMIFQRAPIERFLLIALGLAAPGYTFAWYVTFVYGPRKVNEEVRRLHNLEQAMTDGFKTSEDE